MSTKTNESIAAKIRDFAASHGGIDGATGQPVDNRYRGTGAVRDVAEERRLAAVEAARRRVLDRPIA